MSGLSDGFDVLVSADDAERNIALLRLSVELFTALETHSEGEIRQFGELCINLLSDTPPECRRFVAEKLAKQADAPVELIRLLAFEPIDISEPIILHSPVLSDVDLMCIVSRGGAPMQTVAKRTGNSQTVLHAVSLTGDPDAMLTLAEKPVAKQLNIDSANPNTQVTIKQDIGGNYPIKHIGTNNDVAIQFLEMDSSSRRSAIYSAQHALLSVRVRRGGGSKVTPIAVTDSGFGKRLFLAAVAKRPDEFAQILAQPFGFDIGFTRQLVADHSGEPFALLLAAVGVDEKQALSLFIHVNESVGRSFEKLTALTELYSNLSMVVATKFVNSWCESFAANTVSRPVSEPTSQRRRTPQRILVKAPPKADRVQTPLRMTAAEAIPLTKTK